MKDKLKIIPTCRDPHDYNNPIKIIKELLDKQEAKDETVPPKVKKKVIY